MTTRTVFLLATQITLAAAGGYLSHEIVNGPVSCAPRGELSWTPSFSEIANTKAALHRLCLEFMEDLFEAHVLPVSAPTGVGRTPTIDPARLENARQHLEQGLIEFKGTEQELLIVRALLGLFKLSQDHEGWLDLYLQTLYAHPSDGIAGQFAAQAVVAATSTARTRELLDGFEELRRIPFDFPGKEQINAARNAVVNSPLAGQPSRHE